MMVDVVGSPEVCWKSVEASEASTKIVDG